MVLIFLKTYRMFRNEKILGVSFKRIKCEVKKINGVEMKQNWLWSAKVTNG